MIQHSYLVITMENRQEKCAVVIPYYTDELTINERISLDRVLHTLADYEIILVTPESLVIHLDIAKRLKRESFNDSYFSSVKGYNRLLLSECFYRRFVKYDYILIYQLDAYIISNQLNYFIELGYDYVGAPWLDGMRCAIDLSLPSVWYVGNGGFSLRRVKAFIGALENCTFGIDTDIHEDVFWATQESENFRIAPVETALTFSFERDVMRCYTMNHDNLPFGVHKWTKYNGEFWRNVITEDGYSVDDTELEQRDKAGRSRFGDTEYLLSDQKLILQRWLGEPFEQPIYVWGTGQYGRECVWLLKRHGYKLQGVVDANVEKWGKQILEETIESPDSIRMENCIIIITSLKREDEILSAIRTRELQHNNILSYGNMILSFYQKN